jgi:hypothetical protein
MNMTAVSWDALEREMPELAEFGANRLDGKVAYLATVKLTGEPQANPITPVIGGGHCFVFIAPGSPKAGDLKENGYYCLHCAMNDSSGSSGEFQMSGQARLIVDAEKRSLAESVSSYRPSSSFLLFELQLSKVLSTSYRGGRPFRHKWVAAEEEYSE